MNSEQNSFPPCSHRAYPGMALYPCVRCGVDVGPDLMLCPACFAATRTGRRRAGLCPTCGGRLAAGKCGWC